MPAQRPLRRSQLVSPFGIGAIVDFPNDEALMTGGLDVWPFAKDRCPADFLIVEERLQRRLGVSELRLPPDFRDPAPGIRMPNLKIPFVRFPRWHYCPHCGAMKELSLFSGWERCDYDTNDTWSCRKLPERKRPKLLPSRFVTACAAHGHIQDFPYMEWVHRGAPILPDCRLRLRSTRLASTLAGLFVICTCGKGISLAYALQEGSLDQQGVNVKCYGLRPWLGERQNPDEICGQPLKVIQPGASNIYFPHISSSIYLPLWAEQASATAIQVLEDPIVWNLLSSGLVDGSIDLMRCQIVCQMKPYLNLVPEELQQVAQRKLRGEELPEVSFDGTDRDAEEEIYRQAEYRALRDGRGNVNSELSTIVRSASEYGEPVAGFFSQITLVPKLRETRALYGFSRVVPQDGRTYRQHIDDMRLDKHIHWLPAMVVKGEGIFFLLDEQYVNDWMRTAGTQRRIAELVDNYNRVRAHRQQPARSISPKFILLHTLAHLIINQLSFECGYPTASLRERLFCNQAFPETPMSGILIYTASGDAEGSMGGLVRQGKPGHLEHTLSRALQKALWCSYDPICMESPGQGPESLNLAACHGCAIVPETSCEEGNRLLDRAMVVGMHEAPEVGYFGCYAAELYRDHTAV